MREQQNDRKPESLNDWHRLVNSIFLDRNFYRDLDSIYTHLTEVIGGVSLLGSRKDKPGVDPWRFFAKSLGWWFSLCGKAGVRDVERMIWLKFPNACPYCQLRPCRPDLCKAKKAHSPDPDWKALVELGNKNKAEMPQTLDAWREMFGQIYPKSDQTNHEKNVSRLAEEQGENAEAVRAAAITKAYFVTEAPDIFAWLMGCANQKCYDDKLYSSNERNGFIHRLMIAEYPGKCIDCGYRLCKCPPVVLRTLGRIAKKVPHDIFDQFVKDSMFTVEEQLDYFKIHEDEVVIRGDRVLADEAFHKDLVSAMTGIAERIESIGTSQAKTDENILQLTQDMKAMLDVEGVTQESIDYLLDAVEKMRSDSKSNFRKYFRDVTASMVGSAGIEALKALS